MIDQRMRGIGTEGRKQEDLKQRNMPGKVCGCKRKGFKGDHGQSLIAMEKLS